MPAQGRGAFLTPRAKPPPLPPHRAPVPVPHPSLAHVVGKAVAEAQHVVKPAVRAASHVQAAPITRAVHQAAGRTSRAVQPTRPARGELPPAVLRALIEQHPLVRYGLQSQAENAQLQRNAQIRQIQEQRREAQQGHGSALDLGFVNLTPLASKLATLNPLPVHGALGVLGRLGNEALDLPAQTFLSSAIAGSAGRKALEGNTQPLSQLGGSVLQQVEHPVKSFEEAPLSTALLAAGGENALGRLAGRAGRVGEVIDRTTGEVTRPGVIPAFTRSRPDLKLYGDLAKQQHYNADPLRKAAQVAVEKGLTKAPGRLRQTDPFQAEGWRLERHAVGGIVQPGRVDYLRQAGERTRRVFVNTIKQNALKLAPKHGRDAVPLIFQGIVKTPETMLADLAKERAKLERAAASGDLTSAQTKVNRANLRRVEAILADRKFLADPAPAFAAAERLQAIQRPFEAILVHGGVIRGDQLAAKYAPYMQAHMGAVPSERGLPISADGKPISVEDVQAHMRANGVQDVGFMSHRGGLDAGGSYYQATTRLPGTERFGRTGSAFAKGISDHSWEALVGSMAQKASKAAQLEVRARELNQLALKPKGGFPSRDAARLYGESANVGPNGEPLHAGLGKLVPIHLGPDQILQSGVVDPAEMAATLRRFGLHDEKSLTQENAGKYGLIPEAVNKRLVAHDNAISAKSNVARGAQAYQNAFRSAKLNTSTRHIVGVGAEQAIRAVAEQAGPTAFATGRKFDRSLKRAAELDEGGHLLDESGPLGSRVRLLEAQLGTRGGQVQGYKDMRAIRAGRTWSDTTLSGKLAHGADGAVRSKVGHAALAPWHAWSFLVEGSLARLEHLTHHALLGKALKESGFIGSYRDVLKLQDQAMHELVTKGLTTDKADYIARKVDDFMGNWSHLTPDVRKLVAYVAPFGLWWLNSMRWLYRLPVTHPIKTAIAAAIYHATEPQRSAEGQGFASASPVPGFLQGTVPVDIPGLGPGHANPTYYSPGGTLGPEAINTAIEQFIPALQGPISRGLGLDPLTHKEQTGPDGKELKPGEKGLNALAEAATGPVPFATQGQQLLESGGKPAGNANWITDLLHLVGGPATTKAGTARPLGQVLEKMFLPIRYAYNTGASGTGTAKLDPVEAKIVQQAEQEADRQAADPVEERIIREAEEEADGRR